MRPPPFSCARSVRAAVSLVLLFSGCFWLWFSPRLRRFIARVRRWFVRVAVVSSFFIFPSARRRVCPICGGFVVFFLRARSVLVFPAVSCVLVLGVVLDFGRKKSGAKSRWRKKRHPPLRLFCSTSKVRYYLIRSFSRILLGGYKR